MTINGCGLGGACGHINAFGLSPFPHHRKYLPNYSCMLKSPDTSMHDIILVHSRITQCCLSFDTSYLPPLPFRWGIEGRMQTHTPGLWSLKCWRPRQQEIQIINRDAPVITCYWLFAFLCWALGMEVSVSFPYPRQPPLHRSHRTWLSLSWPVQKKKTHTSEWIDLSLHCVYINSNPCHALHAIL